VTLPPWNDSMSDGCSGPVPVGNPKFHARCVRHDERYYYGGSYADRLAADIELLVGWITDGMDPELAVMRYRYIRAFGGPIWRRKNVSWAFGGEVFAYTDEPATPQTAA
jgi:hypothetical protein